MGGLLKVLLVFWLISIAYGTYTAFAITGVTVVLNGIHYYVPPNVIGTVPASAAISQTGLTPITVLSSKSRISTSEELLSLATTWKAEDDVFQDGFLGAIYLQSPLIRRHLSKIDLGNERVVVQSPSFNRTEIPPGPYFMTSSGTLHQAYRLYPDFQGAFTETVIADSHGTYSVLPANLPGQSLAVAVPSRFYFTKTVEKPLAGVRLGVKDIFDVSGLKTGNGNRAWYNLYPPAPKTAPPVQNLIDAGAIIVGKMITSQFANGETATADWVDYHSPFNPRGDGYQDPSSSSSGPGAGEGAYEWLDITLGSDTGGSVRGPSASQGLFGNRPSHNLVSLDYTMPLAPQLDTPGLLARDPNLWSAAAKAMYRDNITFTSSYPREILTIGFPARDSTSKRDIVYLSFLNQLTGFLQGASVSSFNLSTSWATDNPNSPPINQMLNTSYAVIISKEQTRLVRGPFYADYAAAHDGRRPFVDPAPLIRWAYGEASNETVEMAVANKTMFMDWFNSKILVRDAISCSKSLIIYRTGGATSYRNEYLDSPGVPLGFSSSRISVMAEVPDMVVPVGETSYNSTITLHEETLPLTVNFMAAKGCDGMIFSLVEALFAAGIVNKSQAGKSNVLGGAILLK